MIELNISDVLEISVHTSCMESIFFQFWLQKSPPLKTEPELFFILIYRIKLLEDIQFKACIPVFFIHKNNRFN